MNVCILSMQKVDNMGSLLQSYALKRKIEQLGNEVEFIDIKRKDEDYQLLGDYRKIYCEEAEKNGFLGKVKKIDKFALNRMKIKKKSIEQSEVFDCFRKKYLNIDNHHEKYDLCVIGSDEVFNCLSSGAWGFTTQLFGNVEQADKVITYAASCGSTKYDDLPSKVANKIKETFETVSAFSVRDANTHAFVNHLSNKKVIENLDPVLIYDFDKDIDQILLPKLPKKYCIVYSYYNRIHTTDEINTIKNFCRKHELTPIAVGAPQYWIKDYVVCSPLQCLKIFKNSDFVFTDTFHGTIFSAKYAKKFAVLVRESNKNKLLDLIDKIGMHNHLLNDISEIENKFYIEKDMERFNKIISHEKEKTMEYLKRNING